MRFHVRSQARRHGLVGTVRNLSDGSVETIAVGPRDAVARFLSSLRRDAPGHIERVESTPYRGEKTFVGFEIQH